MDRERYLALFLEEVGEHLAELESALFTLEKDPASADALECCFRMAHSIKGMAASMHFRPITERAHRLEDRLTEARAAGRVDRGSALAACFGDHAALELLVARVRATGSCEAEPAAEDADPESERLKKKVRRTRSPSSRRTRDRRLRSASGRRPSIACWPAWARSSSPRVSCVRRTG